MNLDKVNDSELRQERVFDPDQQLSKEFGPNAVSSGKVIVTDEQISSNGKVKDVKYVREVKQGYAGQRFGTVFFHNMCEFMREKQFTKNEVLAIHYCLANLDYYNYLELNTKDMQIYLGMSDHSNTLKLVHRLIKEEFLIPVAFTGFKNIFRINLDLLWVGPVNAMCHQPKNIKFYGRVSTPEKEKTFMDALRKRT